MKRFLLILLVCNTLLVSAQTAGGPDQFGYTWRNDQDALGPAFNWIDIDSLPGTITVTGLSDDNTVGPFQMPIPFQYYGNIPTQFWIGSNGNIKFDLFGTLAQPFPVIPTLSSVNNYLGIMASDLTFTEEFGLPIPNATCKYWSNTTGDTMVITYANVPFYDQISPMYTGTNTFQVILSITDRPIVYQYLEHIGIPGGSSVNFVSTGIENQNGSTGLQVLFDLFPLAPSAVGFYDTDLNKIYGRVFMDLNSNSVQDSNEYGIQNTNIVEQSTGAFSITNSNGNYLTTLINPGSYTVLAPVFNTGYFTSMPASHSVLFPGLNLNSFNNDFAIQPVQTVNDLAISITPLSAFRPGFYATYNITCFNTGSTIQTPEIYFYPDSSVTFVNSSLIPNAVTTDSVSWILPPLNPLQQQSFIVNVLVDNTVVIGSMVNSSALVLPIVGDNVPGDNISYWEVLVTGSMDPNDILVNRETLFTTEMGAPPFLEYLIRFQNTGNDTAFNVKVMNPISTDLDMNTFEVAQSSSPMDFQFYSNIRTAEFKFNNILLPDSNVNEPLSHGFVRYRIKPVPGLGMGTVIRDSTAIYFDFNTAVMTNTALTEIIFPVGISGPENPFAVGVYPNPVSDEATISFSISESSNIKIELLDLPGQLIANVSEKNYTTGQHQETFSLTGIPKGIYMLRFTDGNKSYYKKIIRM